MDSNKGASEPEIQSMASSTGSAPREYPIVAAFDQLAAAPIPVEEAPLDVSQLAAPDVPIDEDRSALNHLAGTHPEHSPSESKWKSVIEVAVALFAASLTLMLAMPGGTDERGRVILRHTMSFNVFLVTDMLALVASLVVAMTLAFRPAWKVAWFMEIIMWVAASCFLFALLAAGFVLNIPAVKWIIVSFGGACTVVVAVLIYRAFIYRIQSNTPLAIQMSLQHQILNAV